MTEQKKVETPDALPFQVGGNSAEGPSESHDQIKAVDGIKSKRSPDKE